MPLTLVSPEHVDDDRVPQEVDLGVLEGPFLHDLGGSQLVTAVHHGHLGGEAGEEDGLFEGGVAPAGHGDVLLAEEEPVAGGAGRDPVAEEAALVGAAQHERAGAGGDDQGVGLERGFVGVRVGQPQGEGRGGGEVKAADLGRPQLGSEADGLGRA